MVASPAGTLLHGDTQGLSSVPGAAAGLTRDPPRSSDRRLSGHQTDDGLWPASTAEQPTTKGGQATHSGHSSAKVGCRSTSGRSTADRDYRHTTQRRHPTPRSRCPKTAGQAKATYAKAVPRSPSAACTLEESAHFAWSKKVPLRTVMPVDHHFQGTLDTLPVGDRRLGREVVLGVRDLERLHHWTYRTP